jgi:alpha-N-acetylglucosaminidase
VYQKILPGPWGSLAFALTVMFTCWLAGWWMDKRKIYIRV